MPRIALGKQGQFTGILPNLEASSTGTKIPVTRGSETRDIQWLLLCKCCGAICVGIL